MREHHATVQFSGAPEQAQRQLGLLQRFAPRNGEGGKPPYISVSFVTIFKTASESLSEKFFHLVIAKAEDGR
jgi:hypothetical protein